MSEPAKDDKAMNGWPDPNAPGVPLNAERDGRHWLFDAESNVSFPEFWVSGMGAWAVGDAWTPRMVAEMSLHYQGPVLTPAEADALRAENARLRETLENSAIMIQGCYDAPTNPDSLPQMLLHYIRAALEAKL
jgi:hypothetical protein